MADLAVPARVRRCALWGLALGGAYAAFAAAVFVLGAGGWSGHPGRDLALAVALYLGGGLAGGAVVGLLWPLAADSVLGEGVVGAVAIFPLVAGFLVSEHGWFPAWTSREWTVAVLASALLGGLGGPQVAAAFEADDGGEAS